jgi:hypothetical protein
MDVLIAAKAFYRYAQEASATTAVSANYDQLLGLSNKLSATNPPTLLDQNIRSALIATLQQEVDKMELQEQYPITRPESKSAVRNLFNVVKEFHYNLVKKTANSLLISNMQKVRNEWSNYRRSYLSDQFISQLELDKGKAPPERQTDFDKRILFWKALIQQIEETITDLEKLLKDQQTGNPNVPVQPTPV